MVQLVFVHGVATRSGADYDRGVANRELLFREITFKDFPVDFATPMWGDFVPAVDTNVFHTNVDIPSYSLDAEQPIDSVIRRSDTDSSGLGVTDELTSAPSTDVSLATLATQNPSAVLDAIFAELVDKADSERRELNASELNLFRRAAERFAAEDTKDVFAQVQTDADIADALQKGTDASFGILSPLGKAVTAVTDRLRNAVSTVGFNTVRDDVIPAVARFMGDVFVYLKDDALRTKIRAEVADKLVKAHDRAKAGGGPLVVVGHSMGGVILVDMLQKPDKAGLPDDFKVPMLITVGSQPGLFQSLNVLSAPATKGCKAPRPGCIEQWLNVFDPIDPLAFWGVSRFRWRR
jgi:hypothetical protein